MAFNLTKFDPLDIQPRKAIGVKIPFSTKSAFQSTYSTKEATKTNLINYLLTGQGERYLNPTFGTPLRNLLFENITDDKLGEIKNIVRQGVNLYFPKVKITELNVIADTDNNSATLDFSYEIEESNIQDEVVINFEQ